MQIVLASQSSFRKKALELLDLDFKVDPSDIDEYSIRRESPYELAQLLAELKAREVADKYEDALVIASDLFVVKDKVHEKPASKEEAYSMLKNFSGDKVDIVSGLCVLRTPGGRMLSTFEKFTVQFRTLMDHEIKRYIDSYPVTKLAGAFEGDGLLLFADSIEGCYPFLLGIPLNRLIEFLREFGVHV